MTDLELPPDGGWLPLKKSKVSRWSVDVVEKMKDEALLLLLMISPNAEKG